MNIQKLSTQSVKNFSIVSAGGRNGKTLTKIEFAEEVPKFVHAELAYIGERIPFYEDFIKGTTTELVTPESRSRTQLCLVRDFIQTHGALLVLGTLSSRVGSFKITRTRSACFDWGEERLTVSMVL